MAPVAGANTAPPSTIANGQTADLGPFHKLQAELRDTPGAEPITVPFGRSGTIRLHGSMPASVLIDAADADTDPAAAKRALTAMIYTPDVPRFLDVLRLPPDNDEGITGEYLFGFLGAAMELYGAAPLGG